MTQEMKAAVKGQPYKAKAQSVTSQPKTYKYKHKQKRIKSVMYMKTIDVPFSP